MSKHKHRHDHQHRRQQFVGPAPSRSRGLSWNAIIIGAGLLFLGVVVYVTRTGAGPGKVATTAIAASGGGDLTFDASLFSDGKARFYRYTTAAGREIRFFVMKSSDGVIRAAFDSCDVCYRERKGYRQSGDVMICNNCGKAFRSTDINVIQGGCNPAPLDRTVEGGQVVLEAAVLESGAWYF